MCHVIVRVFTHLICDPFCLFCFWMLLAYVVVCFLLVMRFVCLGEGICADREAWSCAPGTCYVQPLMHYAVSAVLSGNTLGLFGRVALR